MRIFIKMLDRAIKKADSRRGFFGRLFPSKSQPKSEEPSAAGNLGLPDVDRRLFNQV
jgi:hypothetical protein